MFNKKTIIIFAIFILLLGLLLFFLFNGNQKETETEITPTPTPETPVTLNETGQGDPNAFQKLEEATVTGYPLFPNTPHRTANWTLDYVDALRLVVTVKGPVTEAIKTEVLNWIKEQGVDPATHQIDWKTTR